MLESHPFFGQLIDVRRHVLSDTAEATWGVLVHVISDDHEDVRAFDWSGQLLGLKGGSDPDGEGGSEEPKSEDGVPVLCSICLHDLLGKLCVALG